MPDVPEPSDPVLRLEMTQDPMLVALWAEFCVLSASQGIDPNKPPPYMRSFLEFANQRLDPHVADFGRVQYAAWKSVGHAELSTRAGERRDTAERVARCWGEALDLLDQLISVAEEFGLVHVRRLQASWDNDPRTHALLIDLHSRGVQVAEETLALLRNGFAAGADARWRTLHETAVVAAFIAKHRGDTVDRYAQHDQVGLKKAMVSEQEHHQALGLEPYSDLEMEAARTAVKELKERYGSAFLGDYGWAAEALGRKPDGKSPTFLDLEASLDLGVFRAAFRSASDAIHAGPAALVDNPGKVAGATPVFLTRGSEFGLLEPGARTAASTAILGRTLMEWRPLPSDRIALVALTHMVNDVGARFRECERVLTQDLSSRESARGVG